MAGRFWGSVVVLAMLATPAAVMAADQVRARIDAAGAAYNKGDLSQAASDLGAALAAVQERLGHKLIEFLPLAPSGWGVEPPEVMGLGSVGGGLAVTRAYVGRDASLNVSIILDSPAVEAAAALIANPAATAAQPNVTRLKVGAEEALMRWDSTIRSGEITIVLGGRVLLEVAGDNLANSGLLVDTVKGWNLAGIRRLTGL